MEDASALTTTMKREESVLLVMTHYAKNAQVQVQSAMCV